MERRLPLLRSIRTRNLFVQILSETRNRYGFLLRGYVVMPEHVHLLIGEPARPEGPKSPAPAGPGTGHPQNLLAHRRLCQPPRCLDSARESNPNGTDDSRQDQSELNFKNLPPPTGLRISCGGLPFRHISGGALHPDSERMGRKAPRLACRQTWGTHSRRLPRVPLAARLVDSADLREEQSQNPHPQNRRVRHPPSDVQMFREGPKAARLAAPNMGHPTALRRRSTLTLRRRPRLRVETWQTSRLVDGVEHAVPAGVGGDVQQRIE